MFIQTISLEQWRQLLLAACQAVIEKEKYLNELDSLIGDGDHGSSMRRGFEAVGTALGSTEFASIGDLFSRVGMELLQGVGGAIGPLLGSFFSAMGKEARQLDELDLNTWTKLFSAGVEKVRLFGKASLTDKTMLDALQPAAEAFSNAAQRGLPIPEAFQQAAQAARQGADQTAWMVAKFGRAKFLGERSLGHQDPGANSIFFILAAMAESFSRFQEGPRS